MDEPGVAQRAAHTLARFLERDVRQADDREARQPGRYVDLDPDDAAVESVERRGEDSRQHAPNLAGWSHLRVICRFAGTHTRRGGSTRRGPQAGAPRRDEQTSG